MVRTIFPKPNGSSSLDGLEYILQHTKETIPHRYVLSVREKRYRFDRRPTIMLVKQPTFELTQVQ